MLPLQNFIFLPLRTPLIFSRLIHYKIEYKILAIVIQCMLLIARFTLIRLYADFVFKKIKERN